MPSKNRIRTNGSRKVVTLQASIQPAGGQDNGSALQIIQETEAALQELEHVGQAATAMVMMNALQIESDGRELAKGQLDLARHASREFGLCFAPFTGSVAVSLSILRAPADGFACPANPFDDDVLMRPWNHISNAIEGLIHLINLQCFALSKQGVCDSGGLTFTVIKRLEAANSDCDKLFVKLSKAVTTICSRAAQPERMAA